MRVLQIQAKKFICAFPIYTLLLDFNVNTLSPQFVYSLLLDFNVSTLSPHFVYGTVDQDTLPICNIFTEMDMQVCPIL
jgi:hypothetical protein